MVRLYPCFSCNSLNRMADTDPVPERCPSCGSPALLKADRRTGRTDTRRYMANRRAQERASAT